MTHLTDMARYCDSELVAVLREEADCLAATADDVVVDL